ncbi:MAG: SAF domain-containing protein [Actinomycetota bacterium]
MHRTLRPSVAATDVPISDRLLAAARTAIARHRSTRSVAVMAVAALVGLSAHSLTDADRRAAQRWGETREVWVASSDVAIGDPISITSRSMPVAVLPPGAVDDDPSGAVARRAVGLGEIVVVADVAGRSGMTALAPDGTTVVPIADPFLVDAPAGAPVAVSSEGILLTGQGLITGVVDGALLVAVPDAVAPAVAAAASLRLASVLLPSDG